MLRNYLIVTLRNLWKSKVYAFINIFSLSVGMAACLLIYLFIQNEQSFDAFHQKKDVIYRLDEVQSFPGMSPQNVALSMPGMGPNLLAEYPEVVNYARYYNWDRQLFELGEKRIFIENTVGVDSTFLEMFDFPLVYGDKNVVLDEPNTVVLTEETANKFFGRTDVVGEALVLNEESIEVKGVLKDLPDHSHLQFDALMPMSSITREDPEFNDRWGSNFLVTYLQLQPETDVTAFEAKMPDFLLGHMNEQGASYYELFLQPLTDVHLTSADITHDYQNWKKFDGQYIGVFSILAVFVLAIAAINFMNLSTARSSSRVKEVGLRKSIGASKGHITRQFLGESTIFSTLALILALGIVYLSLPVIAEITDRKLSILSLVQSTELVIIICGITLIIGLVSGIYPALFISSFQPAKVLKGKIEGIGRKSVLRNVLVVAQFSIAIALIVGTILTVKQLQFMQSQDIGFDKEQVITVPMTGTSNERYETLYNELLRDESIVGVTASNQRLGNNLHQFGARIIVDGERQNVTVSGVNVDYDFLDVYNIELIEGRNFSRDIASDKQRAFIVNESLVKEMGWEEPLGQSLGFGWYDTLGTVVGVVKDFNFNSLHHEINTLAIHVNPDWNYNELSIKAKAGKLEDAIEHIDQTWKTVVADSPVEYAFLDAHFEKLYESDKQVSEIVTVMAVLAIIIACLGLFGLASLATEQRIKEIGIRKVHGANIGQLILLLSRSFALLVTIAFIITVPFTWYLMGEWLTSFAYRIEISPFTFLLAGLVALGIALLTVSYHAIKTALTNPVKALRYE
ncbi:MAG: ABC transporter permease [Bacteroidota bacterium]